MLLDATDFYWPFALMLSTLWNRATSEANFRRIRKPWPSSITIAL